MAVAGLILSAASSAVGIAGSLSQGAYQAQVAKRNAQLAKYNAGLAFERGQKTNEQLGYEQKELLGEQLATQAGSGLAIDSTSSAKARSSAAIAARMDSETVIKEAAIEEFNYKTQAESFKAEAKAAKKQGYLNALGSAFNFVGDLAANPTLISRVTSSSAFKKKLTATPKSVPTPRLKPQGFRPRKTIGTPSIRNNVNATYPYA